MSGNYKFKGKKGEFQIRSFFYSFQIACKCKLSLKSSSDLPVFTVGQFRVIAPKKTEPKAPKTFRARRARKKLESVHEHFGPIKIVRFS